MSTRDASGSAPQHSHPHNNTVSRNKKIWVDQVTPPPSPGKDKGWGRTGGGGTFVGLVSECAVLHSALRTGDPTFKETLQQFESLKINMLRRAIIHQQCRVHDERAAADQTASAFTLLVKLDGIVCFCIYYYVCFPRTPPPPLGGSNAEWGRLQAISKVTLPRAHWEAYGRGTLPLHNLVSDLANPHYVSDPLPCHCGIIVALDSCEP